MNLLVLPARNGFPREKGQEEIILSWEKLPLVNFWHFLKGLEREREDGRKGTEGH